MSIQVKLRRGTTSQHSTFTGSEGEVTVDTDKDVVVVHDGTTTGGHPMVKASSLATVATSGDYNDLINKPGSGLGSVTSVGLSLPNIFDVSGSPVTTAGTLTGTLATQTANKVLASPNGSTGTPTFRSLVAGDIPTLNQDTTGTASNVTGVVAIANGGTGASTATAALTALGAYPASNPNGYTSNTGTVTSVSGTAPIVSSGGTTPVLSIDAATTSAAGSMSAADKAKLDGIAAGAEVNVNADWNAVSGDAEILNKPTLGTISNQNSNNVSITGGSITGITDLAIADGGTGSSSASGARVNLLPSLTGNNGKVLAVNSAQTDVEWVPVSGGGGSVTSVGLSLPSIFDVSGSPITTSGTLIGTLASQTANKVFASPDGATGTPTFRALVAGDIPTLNQNTTGTASNVTGVVAIANGGTGQTTANDAFNALAPSQTGNSGKYLTTNGTTTSWATVTGGGGSAVEVKDEGTSLTTGVTSLNFTGAGVTATASGNDVTVAITSGGISSADIQEFSTTGTSTWTKPAGAKLVHVLIFGGGGGGGSGRRRATASVATATFGGGGGGGGGRIEAWLPASSLGSTETVTVATGGTGGAAQTVDNANGNNGAAGGTSSFGSNVLARGGSGGSGGSSSSGTPGSGGGSFQEIAIGTTALSANGGAGSSTVGTAATKGGFRAGGGGGGGGFAANSTSLSVGGSGGKGGSFFTTSTATTGDGGAYATNGSNSSISFVGGDGGGGGVSDTSSSALLTGGNGGNPGGGGGGGGSGHGIDSGAGGNGGNGYVRVTTYF